MDFVYYKNGKLVRKEIPKKNNKLPGTKRLRKKKLWFKCGDCTHWSKRYEKSSGLREDGKRVCNSCLIDRIRKSRPDLFKE